MRPGSSGSEYLPRTRRKRAARRFVTAAAYRVWRRKLAAKAGFRPGDRRVLLELGSGPGFFLARVRAWFPQSLVIGSDVDLDCVRRAAAEAAGAVCLRSDAIDIPFRNGTLDLVAALQVIEHLAAPERLFDEALRVLKPGGILLVSTPNPAGFGARVLKHRWQGVRRDHISLRAPEEWRDAAAKAGVRVLDHGTTGLTGIPVLKVPPLSLLNWVPMAVFGYFPWERGESLMMICAKGEGA
jgi:SAM-dependent methyltransferase